MNGDFQPFFDVKIWNHHHPTDEPPSIKKIYLVVSTHLKNISQIGNLPQIGVKIKNIENHQLEMDGFRVPGACSFSPPPPPTPEPIQEA